MVEKQLLFQKKLFKTTKDYVLMQVYTGMSTFMS